MRIFVDELPKNCDECPLHRSGRLKLQKGAGYIDAETCVLGNFYKSQEIDNEIDTCPLDTTQSLNQQSNRIKELEEALKNEEQLHDLCIKDNQKDKDFLRKQIKYESDARNRFMKENQQLKQQLAEKEKQLENAQNLKAIEVADELSLKLSKIHNQDKISFAVEQLEQLKKLCQEKFNWWENSEWEGDIYDKSDVSNAYFDIEANVDNQIEELKKEMK